MEDEDGALIVSHVLCAFSGFLTALFLVAMYFLWK